MSLPNVGWDFNKHAATIRAIRQVVVEVCRNSDPEGLEAASYQEYITFLNDLEHCLTCTPKCLADPHVSRYSVRIHEQLEQLEQPLVRFESKWQHLATTFVEESLFTTSVNSQELHIYGPSLVEDISWLKLDLDTSLESWSLLLALCAVKAFAESFEKLTIGHEAVEYLRALIYFSWMPRRLNKAANVIQEMDTRPPEVNRYDWNDIPGRAKLISETLSNLLRTSNLLATPIDTQKKDARQPYGQALQTLKDCALGVHYRASVPPRSLQPDLFAKLEEYQDSCESALAGSMEVMAFIESTIERLHRIAVHGPDHPSDDFRYIASVGKASRKMTSLIHETSKYYINEKETKLILARLHDSQILSLRRSLYASANATKANYHPSDRSYHRTEGNSIEEDEVDESSYDHKEIKTRVHREFEERKARLLLRCETEISASFPDVVNQCWRCNVRFSSNPSWTNHIFAFDPFEVRTCKACHLAFGDTLDLDEHISQSHKVETPSSPVNEPLEDSFEEETLVQRRCELCNQSFPNGVAFHFHFCALSEAEKEAHRRADLKLTPPVFRKDMDKWTIQYIICSKAPEHNLLAATLCGDALWY